MSQLQARRGTLYLVPTPLDFGVDAGELSSIDQLLPGDTLAAASRLTHWITENAKSTRAFLKRVESVAGLAVPLQAQQIAELPRVAHKKGDHLHDSALDGAARELLAPAMAGHDMGLVSEAGMPAIADPGSSVVRAAHALQVPLVPLSGPVSLMLALAASGMNGQSFAFVGYVPQDPTERARRLRELEALATKTGQTQILIETPYRNSALLQAMLQSLQTSTRLAVCCGLSLPQMMCRSALVRDWKTPVFQTANLPLSLPSVFLIGR
ncbi:SAM-dependent methyltransferase [Hydrogenophaga sp.]|uniref:SAM-dependent methyltransferase n=1 Tax=Hydrogenophaga sp. TaxID=1904254 RepID=UPI0025B861E4|nr:SAM-dependent methyltransferase [Hydrogenophaga sp.]